MFCQICNKNEATIHLTEISEGKRSEMHLCESCAIEQGIAVKSQMPLNELLSSLLAAAPSDEQMAEAIDKDAVCPNCGFTLEKFRQEAMLGCPHDYEVFAKTLLPLLEKAHGGARTHCGKVPSRVPADTKRQTQLLVLREQLEAAVKAEDYEQAAQLRDKISELDN